MAKKKKNTTNSYKEAQKAQNASTKSVNATYAPKTENVMANKNPTLTLPVTEIKKDLIKTGVYAVFSLAVIIALSVTDLGYSQLTSLVNL